MNKRFLIFLSIGLLAAFGFIYAAFIGRTTYTPRPPPPPGATEVHFEEYSAWQAWDYLYRFDAAPQVCQRFAIELMKQQSRHRENCAIKTNVFTALPARLQLRNPPPWFDVSTVTNGLLFTADDWFYAVVDQGRGRLYYCNYYYGE
jgi:hypothetical protein